MVSKQYFCNGATETKSKKLKKYECIPAIIGKYWFLKVRGGGCFTCMNIMTIIGLLLLLLISSDNESIIGTNNQKPFSDI